MQLFRMPAQNIQLPPWQPSSPRMDQFVIRQKIQLRQFRVERDELRIRPFVFRQAFPNRLERDLQHGDANQMRNQKRLGANGIRQLQ
jgi:hypothetical protein